MNNLKNYLIKPRTGKAFEVQKGQVLRVVDVIGEQVSDLVCYSREEPREVFSSGRTFDYSGKLFLTTGDVLYSDRSRPMLSILTDMVGGHTCIYAPCSQEMFEISYNITEPHPNCLDNLNQNLASFGLDAHHIGAPFNIFMNVNVTEDGGLEVLTPRSKAGDYIEVRAEMDLIVGITACAAYRCNNYTFTPIQVQIFHIDN